MRPLFIAAILCTAVPVPAFATVRDGIAAWERGDPARATAIWRALADNGDMDAAFNLGQAYRLGRGVQADSGEARKWFERSARSGHIDAQVSLGLLLFDVGDRASALTWLGRAAEKGDPRALLVTGTALFNGDGMKRDPVLGYAYVSRAAAQGLQPAQETLAQLDQLMPVADRQKGIALAKAKAKQAPPPSSRPKPAKAASVTTPAPKSPPSPSLVAATGAWRIQLGAFSQRGAAEALYQRVSGKSALTGRNPYYIASGPVTRLQVGPFASKAAAAAACGAIGVACFPVPAR